MYGNEDKSGLRCRSIVANPIIYRLVPSNQAIGSKLVRFPGSESFGLSTDSHTFFSREAT